VPEEQKREGTPHPLCKVLLEFLLALFIVNANSDFGDPCGGSCHSDPMWPSKTATLETNAKRWSHQFNRGTDAECALEANSSKPDCVQGSLVRITKLAERGKMLLLEVLAIMCEHEVARHNRHGRFRRACVIGVLKEFRDYMPWALNLSEKLMPRTS
jgi:hypothetical protein